MSSAPRPGDPPYVLRLYIAGATPHSMQAVKNCKRICETYLPGQYTLEIIDIYQRPKQAKLHGIIAAPTLIRIKPEPVRRAIGDLSDILKVLLALEIEDS